MVQNVRYSDGYCVFSDAFDHELMLSCLKDIREGKKTHVPVYDFITNARYIHLNNGHVRY